MLRCSSGGEDIASLKFRSGHGMNAALAAMFFAIGLFVYNLQAYRSEGVQHKMLPTMEQQMLDESSEDEEYSTRTIVEFDRSSPVQSPVKVMNVAMNEGYEGYDKMA